MSDSEAEIQIHAGSDDESQEEASPAVDASVLDDGDNDAVDTSMVENDDDDDDDDDVDDDDDDEDDDGDAEEDAEGDDDGENEADESSMMATPAKPDSQEDDEEDNDKIPPETPTGSTVATGTSEAGDIEVASTATPSSSVATPAPKRRGPKPGSKRKRRASPKKKVGIPSTKDLFVPFRAIKRIMKCDKDIGTVQNEAAMVATYAVEMFMEKMVNESNERAKKRGRNTVKYEDLAEVRASHSNMSFLNTLIP